MLIDKWLKLWETPCFFIRIRFEHGYTQGDVLFAVVAFFTFWVLLIYGIRCFKGTRLYKWLKRDGR